MVPEKYRKYLSGALVAAGGLAFAFGVDFDVVEQGDLLKSVDGVYAAVGAFLASAGALVAKFKKE